MLETLVRASTDGQISPELMAVFPIVANLTISTDDSSIMQVVRASCLTSFFVIEVKYHIDVRTVRQGQPANILCMCCRVAESA